MSDARVTISSYFFEGKNGTKDFDQAMLTDLVVWMRANVPYRPHNRTIHLLLISKIVLNCMLARVISHQT